MTPQVRARLRSVLTLAVLAALLLGGVAWAWSAVTEPFPNDNEGPVCSALAVPEGEKVYPDQVAVSVLNAGSREGLAGLTRQQFNDSGFAEGELSNAPDDTDVSRAQIWTEDPRSPAVRLVRSYLPPGTQVMRRDVPSVGVNVVVGNEFPGVLKGRKATTARGDTEICSPAQPSPAG